MEEQKKGKAASKKTTKAKAKPKKLRKTSIGVKVYSMMAIIGVVFLIVVFANIKIMGEVEKRNDTLVNVYVELQSAKGATAEAYQQTAKYCESCVNRPKDVNFAGLESSIQSVETHMAETKEYAAKTGDKNLVNRVDAWEVKMNDFLDSAKRILEESREGDMESASNVLYALGGPYTFAQIAQGDFEELFNAELKNMERVNAEAISQIRTINMALIGVVVVLLSLIHI